MPASSIQYKGYKSPTLHLVYLGFATGTALLVMDKIDMNVWEGSVLGLLTAYVIAGGISKGAEAFINRNGQAGSVS